MIAGTRGHVKTRRPRPAPRPVKHPSPPRRPGPPTSPRPPGHHARATIPHPPKGPVSPYVNPFPRGRVTGARIDQGVDYSARPGTSIRALGRGKIVSALASGSGWPGGGFIGEQLSSGPARGQVVYVAEDVRPTVRFGQRVKAGQTIGKFTAGGSIEAGWGTRPPHVGQALAYGTQSAPGADPGAISTGYGIAFDRLIRGLGGPAGVMQSWRTRGGAASVPAKFSGGYAPGKHRVSLPPPAAGVTIPGGVNPPISGGGGVKAALTATGGGGWHGNQPVPKRAGGRVIPIRQRPPKPPKPPKPPVTVPPAPTTTTITSSLGTGGITTSTVPPVPATGKGSGTTLLLVAGAGVVLLILLMRKGKGKGKVKR